MPHPLSGNDAVPPELGPLIHQVLRGPVLLGTFTFAQARALGLTASPSATGTTPTPEEVASARAQLVDAGQIGADGLATGAMGIVQRLILVDPLAAHWSENRLPGTGSIIVSRRFPLVLVMREEAAALGTLQVSLGHRDLFLRSLVSDFWSGAQAGLATPDLNGNVTVILVHPGEGPTRVVDGPAHPASPALSEGPIPLRTGTLDAAQLEQFLTTCFDNPTLGVLDPQARQVLRTGAIPQR